jgi:hypothetical protein
MEEFMRVLGFVKSGQENSRWVLLNPATGQLFTGKIANDAGVNVGDFFSGVIKDMRPVGRYGGKISFAIVLLWPVLCGANNSRWDVVCNGHLHTYLVPNNPNYRFGVSVRGEIGKLDK